MIALLLIRDISAIIFISFMNYMWFGILIKDLGGK